MVIAADAGMLSSTNLEDLDAAGLKFVVGSRVTKAPADLASHFHWNGDVFTDGQIIFAVTHGTPRARSTTLVAGVNRCGSRPTRRRGGRSGRTRPSVPSATTRR